MSLPNTYTDKNETGCCAIPNITEWDEKELVFDNERFIRMFTKNLMYVPLNMSKIMTAIQQEAESAGASMPPEHAMTLSRDISPWKAEQLYAVTKEVEGADNTVLNGVFLSMVFEGPYSNAKKWYDVLLGSASNRGKKAEDTYFFYTTCPKCAKYYGKNYVIGLVKVV